jgi:hypothetical protein
MSDELERIWEEATVTEYKYYPSICLDKRGIPQKACAPAEILMEYLPNKRLRR